jgi:hypothetical protein
MDHESRDLDGVIDQVAQAMTRAERPRDLRPAIAARLAARQPSWLSVWRVAAASAAAAGVLLVAMMVRPGESPRPAHVADSGSPVPPVPTVIQARAVGQPARRVVARQTIAAATPGIVEISPLAVVPFKTDDELLGGEAPSHMVVIAPIDVEQVRISQLELVE